MKGSRYFFNALCIIVIIFCTALMLAGCGGDDDGTPAISYSGLTTPVAIDSNNAVEISTGAFEGGKTGGTIGTVIGTVQQDGQGDIGRARFLVLSQALARAIRRIDVPSPGSGVSSGAIQHDSGSELGSCGGIKSWNLSLNDQTGDFTGAFTFNNYCEEGTTLAGSIGASGTFNLDTMEPVQITMTFTVFTVSTQEDSFTVHGSISLQIAVPDIDFDMDMYLREGATGKVYWLEDFIMSMTEDPNSVTVSVSGRFYDPEYGYVTISTDTPFVIYDTDDYPSSGVMLFQGEGDSWARLTFLTSTTFRVEADANDGDLIYEYSISDLSWQDY